MGPFWAVISEDLAELGSVRVVARGNCIQWVELGSAWPAVQRPSGSQFLPLQCRLELVHQHAYPAAERSTVGSSTCLITMVRTSQWLSTHGSGGWGRRH
jgi:hypothetical protein